MLFWLQHREHRKLPQNDCEDEEKLLSENFAPSTPSRPEERMRSPIVLFLVCLIAGCVGFLSGRTFPGQLDKICTKHISKYSIVTEEVDISYKTVQFNGSFKHEDVYRQDASPEVDAAWEALGVYYRPVIVPESLAVKSGLTKDYVQVNPKYGGGFPVFVEAFHQLHCLNLLRKSLYYNYGYYKSQGKWEFSEPDQIVRYHVYFIRQRLMCGVDIGTFGSIWVNQSHPRPWVDFNTPHVCRNFEDIRSWAERNQIPAETPEDYIEVPQGGVRILEVAP